MATIDVGARERAQTGIDTSKTKRKMTLEEFKQLPEGPPYYEFEDGELIPLHKETINGETILVSPKNRHQLLLFRLAALTDSFVMQNNLGTISMEVDLYLPDERVFIPDLIYLSAANHHLLKPEDDRIHGVPDLVVEIVSENVYRDEVRKFKVYKANGVPWYWTINAETLIIKENHFLPDGTTQLTMTDIFEEFKPQLFPGLALNLAALMGEELPAELSDASAAEMAAGNEPSSV